MLAAALSDPGPDLPAALAARGVLGPDAELLARMLAGGSGRAQIVAMASDPSGVVRRRGGVLAVLDGPDGRYLLTRTLGAGGVEWSTVAPVDHRRLHHSAAELLVAPA